MQDAAKSTEQFMRQQDELGDMFEEMYGHSIDELVMRNMNNIQRSLAETQTAFLRTAESMRALEDVPRIVVRPEIDFSTVQDVYNALQPIEVRATGVEAPTTPSPTQYITVYTTIEIGEVTAEVDLEEVKDAVNRGLAEALRGAIWSGK